MPTSKKTASTKPSKAASNRSPLPPYGIAIKEALARGNSQEMRKLAVSARKWVTEVQAALDKLEKTIKQKAR
jgi:hypothetical protein